MTAVFSSFSRHVVHLGGAGTGQAAKLFNNALLMTNQAGIAEIAGLATKLGLDVTRLVEVLNLGSASSSALSLLNTMVTLDNVEHLARVEALPHRRQRKGTTMSKLALVTGATSGIGKAFAERLAADGHDLVIVGRRRERLEEFAESHSEVKVRAVAADLSTDAGVDAVAGICATEPLAMLVNNAGVAHYMPLAELPADKARELVHVKVVAPTMLTRAVVAGMQERGEGTIINVAGMIAFSGPAPQSQMPRRTVYAGTLAHLVAMSQTLSAELEGTGVNVQVLCPGVVATEFHERQGIDMSVVPRMTADDVVTASLRGLELGETVCAPGVEDAGLLDAVFQADLAAFGAQSPELATRYQAG
jgi:uncharacterized protein